MSINIKTASGLERINSVRVKPSTAEKVITANGTYNAISDNVDGYSGVTVNVFPGGYVTSGLRFSVKEQPLTMNVYDLSEDNIYLGNGFSISMALIVSNTTKNLSYVPRYVHMNTSSNNWFVAALKKTGEGDLYYWSCVYRPIDYAGAWESDQSVTLLPNHLKWIQIDVLNDSEKTMKLYVNNELKETFTVSGGTVYGAAEKITNLALLRQVPAFSTYDRGCRGAGAADFLLYDRVLTEAERTQNFNSAVNRFNITREV